MQLCIIKSEALFTNFMCCRPDLLASVAYTHYCTSMIRRLGKANIDLIPAGSGDLIIEGIVQTSHICFVRTCCCLFFTISSDGDVRLKTSAVDSI